MLAAALHDVSHRFAGTWVLAHLNLQVGVGERVLLTGDNGAGKTTLLRLLATALRPSRGQVEIFGEDAASSPTSCRRRLTLMTHQHFFYEALSARDNLLLAVRLAGVGKTADDVAAALARVGLAYVAARPLTAFSAGMKRRLALARVVLLEPSLVLLDEPFSQLDAAGKDFVETFLRELAGRGTSWVLSTHAPERAQPLCTVHWHLRGALQPPRVTNLGQPGPSERPEPLSREGACV